jgi:predicted RNase H-like nuclease (RuvC/YqgF family)
MDSVEILQQNLEESENNYRILERECEEMDSEIEYLTNELDYLRKFKAWLLEVYPMAEVEFNSIEDIERSV